MAPCSWPSRTVCRCAVARGHPVVIVQGLLQNQEGAISVLARRFIALGQEHLAGTVPARNFH